MKPIVTFYDTKPYDKIYFEELGSSYPFEINYLESKLNKKSAILAKGSEVIVSFVNDTLDEEALRRLEEAGVKMIALRCAGFNHVDLKYAKDRFVIARVPAYSPYAVAEHTLGLILTLNRKLHRAYNRTREYNFSLNGLIGFDLNQKTIGIIGTGKIGRTFMQVISGLGMNILAYDPYPLENSNIHYVSFDELCSQSDIISLHCPLTKESYHIIDREAIQKMKDGVFLINTSRGALIDSEALLDGIKEQKIGAAGLDVYEEETDLFYEDYSDTIIQDDTLARLITMPNVIVTSHQAFLTKEALKEIADQTLKNINCYFTHTPLPEQVIVK